MCETKYYSMSYISLRIEIKIRSAVPSVPCKLKFMEVDLRLTDSENDYLLLDVRVFIIYNKSVQTVNVNMYS